MRFPGRWIAASAAVLLLGASAVAGTREPRFDHTKHARLFPNCTTCHAGAAAGEAAFWPSQTQCAGCHDGTVEKRVDWQPPVTKRPSNLKFTHARHAAEGLARQPGDSALQCTACHTENGSPRMQVVRAVLPQCLSCHQLEGTHVAVADTACAICHVTLAQATSLSRERIAAFPKPPSHDAPGFAYKGHGPLGKGSGANGTHFLVASSCATCHARDFCITCHVDAPENRTIQALEPDARSLVIAAKLEAPPSHRRSDFGTSHGKEAGHGARDCRTCHTMESCTTCHSTSAPPEVRQLASAGPGRGVGAETTRRKPEWHGTDFRVNHKALATADSRSCATCHARTECLECHRPDAAETGAFHPAGFLTRHPAAAYARETSCAGCHNTAQFCASCHKQSGLVATSTLKPGFHDAKQNFLFGHGQAARQSLETCVGCHAERDCLTCHSSAGGRRFDPHGPGFDAERLKKKNPEMCTVCHGAAIP